MGDVASQERSARFIEEFQEELHAGICRMMCIDEEQTFTLQSICIDTDGDGTADVVAYAIFRNATGGELEVKLPTGCLFDPDYPDPEDSAEMLESWLNLPAATIMERFEKAELI